MPRSCLGKDKGPISDATTARNTPHGFTVSDPTLPTPDENVAGFIPRCTECRYDLSGIPEGVCPECGTPFQLAALRQSWFAPQLKRKVDPRWLLAGCMALSVLCPPQHNPTMPLANNADNSGRATAIWILALAWLLADRNRIFRGTGLMTLWLTVPLTHVMVAMLIANSGANLEELEIFAGSGFGFALLAWILTKRRRMAPLLATFALISGAPSLLLGPIWRFNNWWWTPFSDPRWGQAQVYRQYPLTREEIAPYVWSVFIAAVVLGIAAVWCASADRGTSSHQSDD